MRDSLGRVSSVALVGGTSEIGLATVQRFLRAGAERVVLVGRDEPEMKRSADQLSAAASFDFVGLDVLAREDHASAVASMFAGGDIDVAIMAVGILGSQEDAERLPDHVVEMLETNAVGPAALTLRIAQGLREQGHGTLVVLSSVAAERPRKSNFVYGASKAALDWFAQGLADVLHDAAVQVLIVRPGFVRTRMTAHLKPAPLSVGPDEVAEAIWKGFLSGRTTVWVPAKLRWVMVVLRHLPRAVFRRLPI